MILVDTSIWVDHLNAGDKELASLLEQDSVVTHPFIIAEIALGSLRNRVAVLEALKNLPSAAVATHEEAMAFIDRHALAGIGVGYVDVHLLASVLLTGGCRLWARDKRLANAAFKLGLIHRKT